MAQQDDPLDGLEERLKNHEKAFESLLALTPAREYYGSQIDDGLDPSEQWNRKKQTKEEKRAAKKAKLDPANQKSALDVMNDREKKRKRELGMDDEDNEEDGSSVEAASGSKRQKQEPQSEADIEARRKLIVEKKKERRDRKKEKIAAKRAKAEAKKARRQGVQLAEEIAGESVADAEEESGEESDAEENEAADLEKVDFSGLTGSDDEQEEDEAQDETQDEAQDENDEQDAAEASSAPTSPAVDSPAFDVATNHSEASSSSSISPSSVTDDTKPTTQKAPSSTSKSKTQCPARQLSLPKFDAASIANTDIPSGTSSPKIQLPNIDQAILQERLRKRIEELRAKRKADGPDGNPVQSRQQLLDQRRRKEEQRKAQKKELRKQAREEEARKRDEQLRGFGSPAADIFERRDSPRPHAENNFSFSRLAFEDGTAADASLSTLQDAKKRKGPQDPKTALLAAEKKQARLSGLDEKKRSDIAEKDMWLNAKKHAHGERVRDDTSLLKKALKRKEKQKGRSEKEWNERKEAVVKGKEIKQKKREANLQKRKEEKGQKGKKKGGPSKGGKKARPGFEGRFKT